MSEEIINNILNKQKLGDTSKEILKKEALEIYSRINMNAQKQRRAVTALRLACDKKSCAINILNEYKVGSSFLTEARKQTGIKQIFNPLERVDSQIKMLKNNNLFEEDTNYIASTAKEIISEYQKRTNRLRVSSSTFIDSATAIYLASIIHGSPIRQRDVEEILGISPVTIRNTYRTFMHVCELDILL